MRPASPVLKSRARSETPTAMDVCDLSPRSDYRAQPSSRDVQPPLPGESTMGVPAPLPHKQGSSLAEQERQLEAKCQVNISV